MIRLAPMMIVALLFNLPQMWMLLPLLCRHDFVRIFYFGIYRIVATN